MIVADRLCKSFGRLRALTGVSFNVAAGSIAGFLGPNGAGKTTTLRILAGLLPVESGRAEVAGFDVARAPRAVQRRLGYLPESVPAYTELRVEEYLAYRALLKDVTRRRRRDRIRAVCSDCALTGMERTLIGALSRGYRQRVGLADALLTDPEVLILDEPTAGLDPKQVAEVRQLIEGFRGRKTVLLSSHILGEIEQVCDMVVIIAAGSVRAVETRERWMRLAKGTRRLRLLLQRPIEGAADRLRAVEGVVTVQQQGESLHMTCARDVRAVVFELAKTAGWPLLELASQGLEDYYLQVTAGAGAPPAREVPA